MTGAERRQERQERQRVAAFVDLDLLPVVSELEGLAQRASASATGAEAQQLEAVVARLDDLYRGAFTMWRELLGPTATPRRDPA